VVLVVDIDDRGAEISLVAGRRRLAQPPLGKSPTHPGKIPDSPGVSDVPYAEVGQIS
jgi:hypothetical protein